MLKLSCRSTGLSIRNYSSKEKRYVSEEQTGTGLCFHKWEAYFCLWNLSSKSIISLFERLSSNVPFKRIHTQAPNGSGLKKHCQS